jgi:hypothetical protein
LPHIRALPCRVIDQHLRAPCGRGQIARVERHRARRLGQRVAQRQRVWDGQSVADSAIDGSHGLVGKSLQPQDSGQRDTGRQALVELKAHDVRAIRRGDIAIEHTIDVPARPGLLSNEVERCAQHSITDEWVGPIACVRSQGAESLRQRQRVPERSIVDVTRPQSPQGPQPKVGVVKPFRQLERGGPRRARLARGSRRVHRRPAERGLQLHLPTRIAVRGRREHRQRALDTRMTLIEL